MRDVIELMAFAGRRHLIVSVLYSERLISRILHGLKLHPPRLGCVKRLRLQTETIVLLYKYQII